VGWRGGGGPREGEEGAGRVRGTVLGGEGGGGENGERREGEVSTGTWGCNPEKVEKGR